jgi:hypothetical protein
MAVTNRCITIEDSLEMYDRGLYNNEYNVLRGDASYLSNGEYSQKLYCPSDNPYVMNTKGLPGGWWGTNPSTKYITEAEALSRYTYFDSDPQSRYYTVKYNNSTPINNSSCIDIHYGLLNFDATNNTLHLSKFTAEISTIVIDSDGSQNNISLNSLIDYAEINHIKIRYPISANGVTPTAGTRYLFEIQFFDTVDNVYPFDFKLMACFHYYGTSSIPSVNTRDIPVTIINQTGRLIYGVTIKFCVYEKTGSNFYWQPQYTGEIFPSWSYRTINYHAGISNNSSVTTSITIDGNMLSEIANATHSPDYCKIGIEYMSIDLGGSSLDPVWDNRFWPDYDNDNTSNSSPFKFSPANLMGIADINNTDITITIRPAFLDLLNDD